MTNSSDISVATHLYNVPEELAEFSSCLLPIAEDAPCGPNLEYDTEYGVLQAKLMPRADVQYGEFHAASQPPNWVEIEQDCRRLLIRTRDITLLIWLLRCRTNLAGALGMRQGLTLLQTILRQYPEHVHPQLKYEGIADPGVRANALAALCDSEGFLAEVRQVMVSANTAFRLSLRDIERAFSIPRIPQAMEPDAIKRQLADLQLRDDVNFRNLQAAAACLQDIHLWARQNLADDAPDLSPLLAIMALFMPTAEGGSTASAEFQASEVEVTPSPLEYLKITMSDVVITNVMPSGSSSDERIVEDVSLSFAKVKQEYTVQNQQGGSGGAVTAGYDIKLNKEA